MPDDITPHVFRHDFASWLVNVARLLLPDGQRILGHADLATTAIYLHPDGKRVSALEAVKVGVPIKIVYLRDGERHETTMTPRARGGGPANGAFRVPVGSRELLPEAAGCRGRFA